MRAGTRGGGGSHCGSRPVTLALLAMASGIVVGCAATTDEPDRLERLFAGDMVVIDLTHSLSGDMPYWPSRAGNPFTHDTIRAHADGAPAMAAYTTPEHHGTHIDAPVHSAQGQRSVDGLGPADLFGPAAVISVAQQGRDDPDYLISLEDIARWEAAHGEIAAGAVVLLHTGWSEKWPDSIAYRNLDEDGRLHFPGFSEEVARFLVDERDILGIGIDNMSIDLGDFSVHGITNGAGKFHLENLANLHLLPATGAYLIVAPVKIEGGSGGQVRVFAVVP